VSPVLAVVLVTVGAGLVAGGAAWTLARRRPRRLEPGAHRILFPVVGNSLSARALDAALRIARAEHATLVPGYLASVPMHLPLDAALPRTCETALPVLEAVEQRAVAAGVPVDSRIERGRGYRHALAELIDHERYDRIVVAAGATGESGFTADDVAWLLAHAPGEIVVFRPGDSRNGHVRAGVPAGQAKPA
jgi:universal stress protein family protein